MIYFIINKLYDLIQKPIFWATSAAIFASFVNLLLFRLNRKTFKLLYEKPYIHIKTISIAPKHKGAGGIGMIPDGTYIDMEVINPSSFQNLILNIKVYCFPSVTPVIQNKANIKIDPFSNKNFPQTLESTPYDKYKNTLAKIVLRDIKGRKITKYKWLRNH